TLWYRRLGHVNFKTINKLVKGNLVRGLPSKVFTNDNSCVACKKGKQQRASCKSKTVFSVDQPLFRLHMDLFGPTFVKSLSKKSYFLLITDDYSRFFWVFFLASKDETPSVLKTFIIGLENLLSLKVKIIRCDNGTEFKNPDLNQFYGLKGIKREFSVPRTSQQNGISERKNRTLIEAARTLLADLLLPIPYWSEAVNTACYVQNRVLVTKPHNKTPYELLHGRLPSIGFMRPFGCPVTILNTLDPLGKFQGKETLHVKFMENKPNVAGSGPAWLFDLDSLSQTMNYYPVITKNQYNTHAGFQDTEKAREEGTQTYVLFPVLSDGFTNSQNNNKDAHANGKEHDDDIQKSVSLDIHSSSSGAQTRNQGDKTENKDKDSTNDFSAAGPSNADMPNLEDLSHDADDVGAEADINNMESIISVYRNKKDERGIVMRNKARLVAQGHTQEEGIDYKEVFAPVVRIEAIRLFLAYASFMGFLVYQIDVKSAFLYGTIKEEVYVCQPPGFEDLENPDKVYKVVKALYGLHQAPSTWVFNSPMLPVLRVEMVINSQWMLSKNWLVQKQTAFSKDMSNSFMADNLPKIFWNTAVVKRSGDVTRVGKGFSGVETPLFENMLVVRDVAVEEEAQVLAQALEIVKLKARVKKLEKINMVKSSKLRRLKKVGTSQRVESSDDMENVFNQGRIIADMDQDKGIDLVLSMQEDDTKVQEAVEIVTTAKLMTEVVTATATKIVAASTPILAAKPKILNITVAPDVSTRRRKGVVIRDREEELSFDTPAETPKSREEMEEEDEEIIKSINETPTQKAAKRRKLHEQAKEDEDLKKQLEVVDNEDDDVFIEAIPIGRKVPVVDYEIVMINNKPRYKIIKADGTHQLYISFITLLKNFDREDLEDL
nr:putative ribonuclease H-like domain-containing protein [Tanacetum cinerariifolium]